MRLKSQERTAEHLRGNTNRILKSGGSVDILIGGGSYETLHHPHLQGLF